MILVEVVYRRNNDIPTYELCVGRDIDHVLYNLPGYRVRGTERFRVLSEVDVSGASLVAAIQLNDEMRDYNNRFAVIYTQYITNKSYQTIVDMLATETTGPIPKRVLELNNAPV